MSITKDALQSEWNLCGRNLEEFRTAFQAGELFRMDTKAQAVFQNIIKNITTVNKSGENR